MNMTLKQMGQMEDGKGVFLRENLGNIIHGMI